MTPTASDYETRFHHPPFNSVAPSIDMRYIINERTLTGREALRQWALVKGLPSTWVLQAKDYQLESAYKSRPYFDKIRGLTDSNIHRRKRNGSTSWSNVSLNDLADAPPPPRQSPDIFGETASGKTTTDEVVSPEKLTVEMLTRAADQVIGSRLSALQRDLMASTEAAAQRAARSEGERIGLSDRVKQQIRDLAADSAREVLAAHLPTRVEITSPTLASSIDLGLQHERFPLLLKLISARGRGGFRLNIWLTGPTGSGKTTAVEKATDALALTGAFSRYAKRPDGRWYITSDLNTEQEVDLNGLIYDSPFGGDSSLDADYKVIGYDKADGSFRWTTFLRIFCFGGVYIADEIDNWSPSALVALNAPLANGWVATPAGIMRRHPDSCIIAAANTWGLGATSDYVGRSKLDAATTNRFPNKLDWPYDEKLELALAEADGGLIGRQWAEIVQRARAEVKAQGLQVIFSPRNTYDGIAALLAGFTVREVVAMNLCAGLDPEYVKVLKLDQITDFAGGARPHRSLTDSSDATTDNPLAQVVYDRFYDEILSGNIAAAIKLFREFHSDRGYIGLAAAKNWVEDFREGLIDPSLTSFLNPGLIMEAAQ